MKGALLELTFREKLSVTLASIITATRFKVFETAGHVRGGKSGRRPQLFVETLGGVDSPEHIIGSSVFFSLLLTP